MLKPRISRIYTDFFRVKNKHELAQIEKINRFDFLLEEGKKLLNTIHPRVKQVDISDVGALVKGTRELIEEFL